MPCCLCHPWISTLTVFLSAKDLKDEEAKDNEIVLPEALERLEKAQRASDVCTNARKTVEKVKETKCQFAWKLVQESEEEFAKLESLVSKTELKLENSNTKIAEATSDMVISQVETPCFLMSITLFPHCRKMRSESSPIYMQSSRNTKKIRRKTMQS